MNLEKTPLEQMEEKINAMVVDMVADAQSGKPADVKMTAEERKFFADINTNVGTKDTQVLPEDTINEVFNGLTEDHPFLATLNMQNTGLRMKVIKADTSGNAVWGDIFGDIKGQLDATFVTEDALHHKLTAFIAIPKDLTDFGPEWIKKFVTTQITEAMAVALEEAFINGDGSNRPIGLAMDISKGQVANGVTTYPKKTAAGTIDFSDHNKVIQDVAQMAQDLAITESGKMLPVDNVVNLAVSPADYHILRGTFMMQNAAGVYVENYPLGIKVVPATGVEKGEAIAYIPSRYDAAIGGGLTISNYDQTLAMEDMNLNIAKQFAYGKAIDNKASRLYKITLPQALGGAGSSTTPTESGAK